MNSSVFSSLLHDEISSCLMDERLLKPGGGLCFKVSLKVCWFRLPFTLTSRKIESDGISQRTELSKLVKELRCIFLQQTCLLVLPVLPVRYSFSFASVLFKLQYLNEPRPLGH